MFKALLSAQLRTLFCWCNSDYQSRWKNIEENFSGKVPIQACLGDKILVKNIMEKGNNWITLSLKIWLNVVTKSSLSEEIKILRWCSHDLISLPTNWILTARDGPNEASPLTVPF